MAEVTVRLASWPVKRLFRYQPASPTDRHLGQRFGSSTRASGSAARICAIRPDEVLVLGTEDGVAAVSRDLPDDESRAAIDLSHGLVGLEIDGPATRSMLAKVCDVDLGALMLPPGACAPALVAEVACDIVRLDSGGDEPFRLLLLAPRSYAHYLLDVLVDAGQEFGMSPF